MNGAFLGLLLAQSLENGIMPSRPISCTTRLDQPVLGLILGSRLTPALRKNDAQDIPKSR